MTLIWTECSSPLCRQFMSLTREIQRVHFRTKMVSVLCTTSCAIRVVCCGSSKVTLYVYNLTLVHKHAMVNYAHICMRKWIHCTSQILQLTFDTGHMHQGVIECEWFCTVVTYGALCLVHSKFYIPFFWLWQSISSLPICTGRRDHALYTFYYYLSCIHYMITLKLALEKSCLVMHRKIAYLVIPSYLIFNIWMMYI